MKRTNPNFFIPIHKRPSFFEEAPGFNFNTICNFLREPKIDLVHPAEKIFSKFGLEAGHASIQGYRSTMEDQYIMEELTGAPGHFMFAILDGHAGAGTSHYVSQHLPSFLIKEADFKDYLKLFKKHFPCYIEAASASGEEKVNLKEEVDEETEEKMTNLMTKAITKAFLALDKRLKYLTMRSMIDISGSTCICSVVTPTHIITANIGDSRSVVGGFTNLEDGKDDGAYVVKLSVDHKPKNKLESERIIKAGGFIKDNRINSALSLSRAFGDFIYKNVPELPVTQQKVIAVPDVAVWKRRVKNDSEEAPSDRYLLLACDGVWDVMRREEAIDFLKMSESLKLFSKENNYDDEEDKLYTLENLPLKTDAFSLAGDLVYQTLSLNSYDNISVLVVKID